MTKRAWQLQIGGILSAAICLLSAVIIDKGMLKVLYHSVGFYFMFVTFFLWVFIQMPRKLNVSPFKTSFPEYGPIFFVACLVTAFMFMASPIQFRILADETNLLGVALSLYDQHEFFNTTQGLYYFSMFHETGHTYGIRPIFFPFLIYLVHSIKGYSAYNGFLVNAIAGTMSLFCFYWLSRRWFSRIISLSGMLCLAAYPVFVMWVTSSGFEIVNLLLAIVAFCWFARFLETDDTYHLERMLITLVLLSQTRYESAVFTVGLLIAVFLVLKTEHYDTMSFRFLLWPWLFLPVLWQRVLKSGKSDYQVYSDDAVFSADLFVKHAQKAWSYFTSAELRYGIISILTYLAAVGLAIGCYKIWLNRRTLKRELWPMALAALISHVLLGIAIFSYYWGDLTAAFTIRLGIIFLPVIVLLSMICMDEVAKRNPHLGKMVLIASLALLFFYWPVAGKSESCNQLSLHRQYKMVLPYMEENYPERNTLIIADRPGMYTVHRWGAVKFAYANKNKKRLLKDLERRLYKEIVVIQLINYSDGLPADKMHLDEAFNLDSIFETQYNSKSKVVVSRVVKSLK